MQAVLVSNILKIPKRDITITKLKIKGDSDAIEFIEIYYDLPSEKSESKSVKFICKDQPRNEFFKAIELLLEDVCIICGLDLERWETGKVSGITFKHSDEGMDVVITAQTEINDFNIIINTPLFHPKDEIEARLNNAIAHIEDYINGKRAQTSLFESAEK